MSNLESYSGTKDKDGKIEGNYLPTPRTFVSIGKLPASWGNENLTEMGITLLFSKDGMHWGSVDTAIYNAALKKKYTLADEKNNYVMSMALELAPKCRGNTASANEDWGIKVDADKLAADQKTYEDAL
jgi:hypothetical protein